MTHGDERNILYLDVEEARSYAAILNTEIRQRTRPSDEVVVLDAILTVAEAQVVAIHLDWVLVEESSRCQNESRKVKWQQEGF